MLSVYSIEGFKPELALAIAALLDFLIGDPDHWFHPVQGMGWLISRYSQWVFRQVKPPRLQRVAGILLGIGLIGGSGCLGWAIAWAAAQIHWTVAIAVNSILLASCFAGRSLRAAAETVLTPLATGNLEQARDRLSRFVGRDTDNLPEPEILRAVLETVSENATDGVTAPLFYAIVGLFLPPGSLALALAYKAASTLDSMVGYRTAPYTHLGWFSARLEDGLTWLPCRLTVLTLALISRQPWRVLSLCRRDAPKDPSPNAGWSECAYAAILGVQLGGTNTYRGRVTEKPLLGDRLHPIASHHIHQATRLTRQVFLLWLGVALVLSVAQSYFGVYSNQRVD